MDRKVGWLVNDCLTCIPNTKTIWHFLLEDNEWLLDKTNGYTNYSYLPDIIENNFALDEEKPDYIIRNATFFRPLKIPVKTISLLQDPYEVGTQLFKNQIEVCNQSDYVVFNSEYTKEKYQPHIQSKSKVIPVGTDDNLFRDKGYKKDKNTIIYIGSTNEEFKGFSMVRSLIDSTQYNFILVMKDDFELHHPRVQVYNKINQDDLANLINMSDVLICTSKKETLHLAGIEAAFCNTPVVANDTGIYSSLRDIQGWGKVVKEYSLLCYNETIKEVINSQELKPREIMNSMGLSIGECQKKWKQLIHQLGINNE
jgi:glycosyltransferase involved in cell wall biosynthesis